MRQTSLTETGLARLYHFQSRIIRMALIACHSALRLMLSMCDAVDERMD